MRALHKARKKKKEKKKQDKKMQTRAMSSTKDSGTTNTMVCVYNNAMLGKVLTPNALTLWEFHHSYAKQKRKNGC